EVSGRPFAVGEPRRVLSTLQPRQGAPYTRRGGHEAARAPDAADVDGGDPARRAAGSSAGVGALPRQRAPARVLSADAAKPPNAQCDQLISMRSRGSPSAAAFVRRTSTSRPPARETASSR